ncbi:hypothetical protein DSECCO2_506690 [anaerobic digester metagenome]
MDKTKIKDIKSGQFNKRAFASTGLFISGLGLPITGLLNHFLAFDTLTVERHAWMSAHNVLGLLFLDLCQLFRSVYAPDYLTIIDNIVD